MSHTATHMFVQIPFVGEGCPTQLALMYRLLVLILLVEAKFMLGSKTHRAFVAPEEGCSLSLHSFSFRSSSMLIVVCSVRVHRHALTSSRAQR